ncbi:MAG: hypothetical protein HY049_12320 [Acidobacteria bacterium]|nr:hypothetical protein [Acidobacteriota bacterium]
MRAPRPIRATAVLTLLALAALPGASPADAHPSYFSRYCAKSGCHDGTSPDRSPADGPTCAGCHYHGMFANGRTQQINFRGWTDKSSYSAGEPMTVFVTGGNQPGWIRARVEDENGVELARATGPTGIGDDGDPNWTASRLPGPIVLRITAPYVPGTHRWRVAWFGNIQEPNPPASIAHVFLRWHAVPLPPFDVVSTDATGPTISGITMSPTPTGGVRQIAVRAIASDATSGMSPIREARVHVGSILQEAAGVWRPLVASDGQWSSAEEGVTGTLDISGLLAGSYMVDLQGADILGNWGPVESAPFEVTAPPEGDVQAPSASCGAAWPAVVPPGQPVYVRAGIDDSSTGGSPIYGAEAFLGAPGQDGTGVPLEAEDGVLDSAAEETGGDLPTTGLADGVYPVVIHGVDAAGLWSPYCDASFEVNRSADTTGPTVMAARFAPSPTSGAPTALLYATADDASTGNAVVTAAEYYVGTAPPPGEGIPMTADDGAFDSPRELLTAAMDVTAWPPGAYVAGVRAKDAAGHWGKERLVPLSVSTGGPDEAGPEIVWFDAMPHHTSGARRVTLMGKVDDSATGGSRPAFVEYSLDGRSLPGAGTLVRLKSRNSAARFRAIVDVRDLVIGATYTVYARAMDTHGNWGPLSTTAFKVTTGRMDGGMEMRPAEPRGRR